MEQSIELANRLREVILNGTWIANTNYKDQLTGLDWRLANAKISNLNTIADLAQHIHYYIFGILNAFVNHRLAISDKYSFDFKPIKSQIEWDNFLEKFWQDTIHLAEIIEVIPVTQLNTSFFDERYGTYSRNINGLIEHSYYHLAQIVILKKSKNN